MKFSVPKFLFILPLVAILVISFAPKLLAASINTPQVSITTHNNQEGISVVFPQAIQSGNIVDIELYNSSNAKVWQYSSTTGGTNFSATPPLLSSGTYFISIGVFTPNWTSNISWYDRISTLTVATNMTATATDASIPTDTPPAAPSAAITTSPTSIPSTSPSPSTSNTTAVQATTSSSNPSVTQDAYNQWKAKYVIPADSGLRVVRPENSNDTVSEGMGYGMLLSMWAKDQGTFAGLWQYTQKYLDSKGLMNWQISSGGSVIGQGSATDADEDIAYALVKAASIWPGQGYDIGAKNMIAAIKRSDTVNNFMNPGDNWGATTIMDPSYLAPSYYRAFATFTGDTQWNDIASKNSSWLQQAANSSTGLLPDWLNADFSQANIGFDTHKNDFFYDAVRTPIRLLMAYKSGDQNAASVLQKQNWFFSSIGADKLTAGYTMFGQSFANYMDSTFLSGVTAASQIDPNSNFAKTMVQKLTSNQPTGYFGTSLRAITLFILAGNN